MEVIISKVSWPVAAGFGLFLGIFVYSAMASHEKIKEIIAILKSINGKLNSHEDV